MISFTIADYASIAILLFLTLITFRRRDFLNVARARGMVGIAAVLIGVSLLIYSIQLFLIWKTNEVMMYALPPHQGVSYYIYYVLARFWSWYLLSGLVAFVVLLLAIMSNRKKGNQLFYPEEPYFLALGIFTVAHPLWVVYIVGALVLYFIFSFIGSVRKKNKSERVSFYYAWLPLALAIILAKPFLLSLPLLEKLIIAKM